jgi:hypothetical protein
MSDTTTTADTPDLAAKIAALETSLATLAERHKPSDDEDDDPTSDVKALRQRLSKEAARRRDLAADLGRVTQEFAAIKQQHVEVATTAEQRIAALAQQHETALAERIAAVHSQHLEDLAMADLDIKDDLGRSATRQAWESTPEDKRGESPSKWWAGVREQHAAHLADPEKVAAPSVPRTMLGYLAQPGAAQVKTATAPNTERNRAGATPPGRPTTADILAAKTPKELAELMARFR